MDTARSRRRRKLFGLFVLGAGLTSLAGCQTWTAGMTLPSPRYLEHQPQYFAPSPIFPLPKELAQQEATWNAPVPGGPAVPLPQPIAPGQ
jgi:hypothetical protein